MATILTFGSPIIPQFRFMKRSILAGSLLTSALLFTSPAGATVFINEVDSDTPTNTGVVGRTNDDREFIELYNDAATPASLNGMFLLLINGGSAAAVDRVYQKYDLSTLTIPARGFVVIGNPEVTNVSSVTFVANTLQNGEDAVVLYQGDLDKNGAAISTNSSTGTTPADLDPAKILDAVAYGTADPVDPVLMDGVGVFNSVISGDDTKRHADENANVPAKTGDTQSVARKPDGGTVKDMATWVTQDPTPGTTNAPTAQLTLTFSAPSISEAGGTATATLTRVGADTTAALTVTIKNLDTSELTTPATIDIPAGSASVTFAVTGANDEWPDGNQDVTVEVSAPAGGILSGNGVLTVNDDNADTFKLVFNEVGVANALDANGDGVANFDDEFVEIVNVSASAMDLSGFQIWVSQRTNARHVFPAGTILAPGCAMVVFAGSVVEGVVSATTFGGVLVQKCSNIADKGLFFFDDRTNTVSLRNAAGVEFAGFTYNALATGRQDSFNLATDGVYTSGYAAHTDGGIVDLLSPGTKRNGSAFCPPPTESLGLTLDVAAIDESAGAGAATLTLTLPTAAAAPVTVALSSSDTTEAVPSLASVIIPAGQTSVTIPVNAIDDNLLDGDQPVIFRATSGGYINGATALTVRNTGLGVTSLFINEIDTDQDDPNTVGGAGNDDHEFIELYAPGQPNRLLDGYTIAIFSGTATGTGATAVIPLAGFKTNAAGFCVIGDAAVTENGLVSPGWPTSSNSSNIINGSSGVALYRGAFARLTVPTSGDSSRVDAVIYGLTGNTVTNGLDGLLNTPGVIAEGSANNLNAIARVPDAATGVGAVLDWVAQTPTPGATNGGSGTRYSRWAAAYPGIGGPTDDSDGDGLTNLEEYAFGSNPKLHTESARPRVTVDQFNNYALLAKIDPSAKTDPKLQIVAEASATLDTGTWSGTLFIAESTSVPGEVSYRYQGSEPRMYMHLKITLLP